jgi:hypothetical protein
MEKRRRVLLYGRSLILESVGASLQQYSRMEIVFLSPPLPTEQELGALAPDVIIFDVDAAHPELAISLLKECPSLLLIGIDPGSDQMLLWSGQTSRVLTTDGLVQMIEGHAVGLEQENVEVMGHVSRRTCRSVQVLRPRKKRRGR